MNISHTRRGAGRMCYGRTPPAGAVYVVSSPCKVWHLWRLPPLQASYTGPWRNYRLVADRNRHKANFTFGYNVAERRVARNHDTKILDTYPEYASLSVWVREVLRSEQ